MDGLNFVLLLRLTYRDIYMSRDNEMKSYSFILRIVNSITLDYLLKK